MTEENYNLQPIVINDREELEMLVMTSIPSLKKCKEKYGREDVYNLVEESLGRDMSIENFN